MTACDCGKSLWAATAAPTIARIVNPTATATHMHPRLRLSTDMAAPHYAPPDCGYNWHTAIRDLAVGSGDGDCNRWHMCSATADAACAATRPCTSLMRITVDDLCPATADDNCNGLRALYASQPALARCDAAAVTLALCNATIIAPRLRSTVYRACGAAMGC